MSFTGGNFIEHNHETEHVREINMMQIEIAMDWKVDISDKNQKFIKWTELYSKKFRQIIDDELDANEFFWEDFKDASFREVLIGRIEEKLYKDEQEPFQMAA